MSNTFGTAFRLTSYGESHGVAIGGIVDGCPSGLVIDYDFIDNEMQRRHGTSHATHRHEKDEIEWMSGIFDGKTLGTPIAFRIANTDQNSQDYESLSDKYRPGHADFTYQQRYKIRDWRGGGRASGRETAVRVAAGAIAKLLLKTKGISIQSSVIQTQESTEQDSAGGIVECRIDGVPAGIGNPIFGKLNATLAAAVMSIPSAIGYESGAGFSASNMRGSDFRDEWADNCTTRTNHCGGIQGGISNGMPITFRVAFHPVVTVGEAVNCLTEQGAIESVAIGGRHDRNHVPRTAVVVEAMAALAIADSMLLNH